MKYHPFSQNTVLSALCVAVLSANPFLPTNAIAADTTADSLTVVLGSDTLSVKRLYSLAYPAYEVAIDSSLKQQGQASSGTNESVQNGLEATGSISRGIQVSSNASVSLQSNMYLKIKGTLSENYSVSGVLTDKTSPLQPVGNTRRLNDFDRVIINIDGPALHASIGDIDLKRKNGRFGRFERSIEGISLNAIRGKTSVNSAVGFSYGTYHLLQLQGKDGKQGPYRLIGKNDEKFIIVLAGSESVRIDDQPLQRGEDADYTIDYNAAEIHFTQKRILSSNSRISIEFEYVPDIYLTSYSFGKQLISGGVSIGNPENSPLYLSAAWHQLEDDKNNPLGSVEKDELGSVFSGLGDDVNTAFVSTIIPDSVNGKYADILGVLVYTHDYPGQFSVDFNYVGLERGEYRRVFTADDSYYVYDQANGEYLPVKQYNAPQSTSVFSINSMVRKDNLLLKVDLGISRNVQNAYSNAMNTKSRVGWDTQLGTTKKNFGFQVGDKHYDPGFISHDALETSEYYRKWRVSQRLDEQEDLKYGSLRIGQSKRDHFSAEISQFSRSSVSMGNLIELSSRTDPTRRIRSNMKSTIARFDTVYNQYHSAGISVETGRLLTRFLLDIEDASSSPIYQQNDHLISGLGLTYKSSPNDSINLDFNQRLDYKNMFGDVSFLQADIIEQWSDRRRDLAASYYFSKLLNSRGGVQAKYREHQTESGSVSKYYLGKLEVSGKTLNQRVKFQETYLIDEEHIPKYDYHYLEVDTGYGDYSYDPYIKDYIPLSGGRYIRQRVFSDIEEQVRKFENKSRLEYTSTGFTRPKSSGIKSSVGYESRLKLQVDNGTVIQSQSAFLLNVDYRLGNSVGFQRHRYSGRVTDNSSLLYNYGAENNAFVTQNIETNFLWNAQSLSTLGFEYEERQREIEYNLLATEDWRSFRPFIQHTYTHSSTQKLILGVKYSRVQDLRLDKSYSESFLEIDHNLRVKRRGRFDQKMSYSIIQADVEGIPYSVFSGRQPGENWKYNLNGRYIFSSLFQMSLNYSIQKRGENRSEQFLRLEGRTHF